MLSFVTGAVPDKPAYHSAAKVRQATLLVRAAGYDVEGPIQFDAAVVPSVAATKFKGGERPMLKVSQSSPRWLLEMSLIEDISSLHTWFAI